MDWYPICNVSKGRKIDSSIKSSTINAIPKHGYIYIVGWIKASNKNFILINFNTFIE